ncbi:MAG: N-6 DNA methylase [Phycisphaerae bacterium]
MSEHASATGIEQVKKLVQGFRVNLKNLRDEKISEAVIRQEYIDPFWKALGWDVANTAHRSTAEKDVVIEATVGTIESERMHSRRPDYLFRIDGFPRFVVEAKKPAVDLQTDRDAIFQAKTYAWSAQIPFAILTDFEEFRLFDATLKPYHAEPSRGLIQEFDLRFENYETQWDALSGTFCREAVAGGSLERLLAKIKHVQAGRRVRGVDRMLIDLRGSEPVDRVFLKHLEDYRLRFARALYKENRSAFPEADTRHGAAKLTEAVQRLVDRLVFIRVCEDRGVLEYGTLRQILNRAADQRLDVYPLLTTEFRDFDAKFNGYLFKAHSLSEQLTVPADLLAEFIRSLYLPEGPYRFEAIGDDLLGIIYERFLGSTITVKKNIVEAEEKPEVRHAGGVYYTPRFVVDTIVRRVVGPKVQGKTPLEILDVKILDPACGSGSFLISALQYLYDHCTRYVTEHPDAAIVPASPRARKRTAKIAFKDDQGQWHLSPEFRGRVLASCMHGVDIDAQAAEVTIMSLYLKLLEGRLPPNWQRDFLESRLLPPLDNNVSCGNSLLSQTDFDRYWENEHATLFGADEDVRFRINAFDWTSETRGFGRLFKEHKGFDCIIGNPPYIRVQELNKWSPDECEFYKRRYKSAAKGNYDIYVVFIERGLELLAPDGLLGFICPHKFWQASYGQGIREVLSQGRHLRSIVDFADQQVFRGAATYTAIQIFSKKGNTGPADYAKFNELTDGDAQCRALDSGQKPAGTSSYSAAQPPAVGPWRFESRAQAVHGAAVAAAAPTTLGDLADRMFQGIRTSMNDVFVLRVVNPAKGVYRSEARSREIHLEADLLKPFLAGEDIRRYEVRPASAVVVFPYKVNRRNGTVALVPADRLADECPKTWDYLKECEQPLRRREHGKMDHDEWYGYIYPKNLDLFGIPRIIVRDIVEHASFALDAKGEFAFVSGYGVTLRPEDVEFLPYLLGLLNSRLLDAYLKSVSTTLRGGWFRPFPQFLKQLPIKLPKIPAEKKLAEQISERVGEIIAAKKRLQAPQVGSLGQNERERLERGVEAHEAKIDELVCRLYGVDHIPE